MLPLDSSISPLNRWQSLNIAKISLNSLKYSIPNNNPMLLNQISHHGSSTYSFFNHFPFLILKPHQISLKHTHKNLQKYFNRNWSRLRLHCFNSNALSNSFDELSIEENKENSKEVVFLQWMENRGIKANHQTFFWLLEGCLNSGSLEEGKKLRGKILKMGFSKDHFLSEKLVDIYIALGELDDAIKVFDDMPNIKLFSWNKLISGFVSKKMNNKALGFYSMMVAENVNPNERTFSSILKACSGGNVWFEYVEQIHVRIIRHGFGFDSFVCNPLIDLYMKNGFIDSGMKLFNKLYVKDKHSFGFWKGVSWSEKKIRMKKKIA